MRLLTSSLIAVVLVALLVAGGARLGTRSGLTNNPVMSLRGDVPEVVVTAQRPGRLMPEVLVVANRMPEVVVRATSAHPERALPSGPTGVSTISPGVMARLVFQPLSIPLRCTGRIRILVPTCMAAPATRGCRSRRSMT